PTGAGQEGKATSEPSPSRHDNASRCIYPSTASRVAGIGSHLAQRRCVGDRLACNRLATALECKRFDGWSDLSFNRCLSPYCHAFDCRMERTAHEQSVLALAPSECLLVTRSIGCNRPRS